MKALIFFGSFSNRDNVRPPIQFRKEIQPQHLKRWLSWRTDPSIFSKSTSHVLPQSTVSSRSDSSSKWKTQKPKIKHWKIKLLKGKKNYKKELLKNVFEKVHIINKYFCAAFFFPYKNKANSFIFKYTSTLNGFQMKQPKYFWT